VTSDEKEPQKYKGMKKAFKSATTETIDGEPIDVPNYAFLIFDVSVFLFITKLRKNVMDSESCLLPVTCTLKKK
jgi:hypothetical protein